MKRHIFVIFLSCVVPLTTCAQESQYQKAKEIAQKLTHHKLINAASPRLFMQEHAKSEQAEDAFHSFDVPKMVERYEFWQTHLPTVKPYYALKTNPDHVLVSVLAGLGTGFDCASLNEINQVLSTGIEPSKIIFAHTRKSEKSIEKAYALGIKKMTFDSLEELKKIHALAPDAQVVLRIKTNDEHSLTPLSTKFGATMTRAKALIDYAHKKGITLIGISFHIGSNASTHIAYLEALNDTLALFDYAKTQHNMPMSLIDLGGGWPGANDALFIQMADAIKAWLNQHPMNQVEIIAEPGRYFSTPVMHTATKIIGKEIINENNQKQIAYYLADGAYGLFMASIYYQYQYDRLKQEGWNFSPLYDKKGPMYVSTLWGPTCDSGDYISKDWLLPELESGEYLYSNNVGAYTISVGNTFNQIEHSKGYYLWTKAPV